MKYILKFLTKKGVEAYRDIKAEKVSLKGKLIVKKIFREKEISDNPLTIEIRVLIPWLAIQERIDNKIIEQMSLRLCERDLDYTLEVY